MTNEEWAVFAPFLVREGARSGRPPTDHRLILDAVFWIARTGAPWRDLDATFPKWTRVLPPVPTVDLGGGLGRDPRGSRRERRGPGQRPDDRQYHRTRPPALGGREKRGFTPGPSHHDIGRSRGGLTTKNHLRANGLGLPVALLLTPGEALDAKGFGPVIDQPGPEPKVLIADKGYDSDAIRDDIRARGAEPVIPMKRNRVVQGPVDSFVYALRNRIERSFNRLKNDRRIATRYDKTSASYLGFAPIGAIRLWIRCFVNTA